MHICLISDLHLDPSQPHIADIFLRFLKEKALKAKALYILGDFFEAWIGDDDMSPFNQQIISALRTATSAGLPIYFMHGNRDFLIGKKFLTLTGCQLLPDEYVMNVFGTNILCMHGDTLCTKDHAYLKFRKKSRSWLFKKFIMLHSLAKRKKIAAEYRAKSKAYTSTAAAHIMDVTQSEVERVMLKNNVSHLIHGHTHRPAIHEFPLMNQQATRTVLAPWHDHGSVLVCDSDGKKYFEELF